MLRGERLGGPGSHAMDDSGLGRRGCISTLAVSAILTGRVVFLPTRFAAERCWSGRTGLPAKQLHLKRVSGVRIPPSPPNLYFQWVGFLPKAFPKKSSISVF